MSISMDSVTESELRVLKSLWSAGVPLSANQIVEELTRTSSWGPSTIRTLIGRLVTKDAIECEQREVLYYRPKFQKSEYAAHQAAKLILEFYSGKAGGLIATLHGENQLSEEDIAELKRFLDEVD
jgi:BlaI family transcriptional regulator, penicillinase repressor